jgi:hypothetical protein
LKKRYLPRGFVLQILSDALICCANQCGFFSGIKKNRKIFKKNIFIFKSCAMLPLQRFFALLYIGVE